VDTKPDHDRYHRQVLLPQVGSAGQARLRASRALLVGCGALGGVIAEQLARAGVGSLRIVDRDVVEWTNLQRQVLFEEADARDRTPKAVAAARRLARVNGEVTLDPVVADVHSGNIESLAAGVEVVLDGTDNVETRYLINDVAVKHAIPWVYGACVGTEGRVMPVVPGRTACLRCVFREPPAGAHLPTCDTAGVLGPIAAIVASLQTVAAIKLLTGNQAELRGELWWADLWAGRMRTTPVERNSSCPTCGRREFDFLDRPAGQATTLCGRGAIQVRPAAANVRLDLTAAARKLTGVGDVELTPYLVRCRPRGENGLELTLFADGRMIVAGTTDRDSARSLYARYVGA
jgi:adenylyltransferase/sulfurtransferase